MTEKEYNELLARIVKGAKMIENPLLDDKTRKKYMKLYDQLCEKVMETKNYWPKGG